MGSLTGVAGEAILTRDRDVVLELLQLRTGVHFVLRYIIASLDLDNMIIALVDPDAHEADFTVERHEARS